MRRLASVFVVALLPTSITTAQVDLLNGQLQARNDTTPASVIEALAGAPARVWLAWQVPMIDGVPSPCSSWSDDTTAVRGERLGDGVALQPPHAPPPAPRGLRLDAGTRVTILARAVAGRLERLRVAGDDCPIDAAGQTVQWLGQITPAESAAFLDAQTSAASLAIANVRRLAESAVLALGYHADPLATAGLDRLTSPSADPQLRRQAARVLARTRGARGLDRVVTMIKGEPDSPARQELVSALAESPLPEAIDALLTMATTDPAPTVRGEAAYWHVRRTGAAGLATARRLLDEERHDDAARRIVTGIAATPAGVAVPALLDLAQTTTRLAVRKEAVRALGNTNDPQALRYLEELVGRR